MAFDIDAFQKKLRANLEPNWKPGRWETTSPIPDEQALEIEYRIIRETTGCFRLKGDPNNRSPGKIFQMTGDAISGWQRYDQKLFLESGRPVSIPGEFIKDDGTFETGGEILE